ncbi:alpha/beta fold hydrolase [Streptomyces sp. NPDC002928]|uniref:alpha/beta fold hydrolase n=1 Tax=Streptomyces sp. NPDC002928 TaxID=3154440 RepID=UPI0033A52198
MEWATLDLAGSGDRTAASGPFDYDRFAAEVGTVVDALGKPFVIVGQSMGAVVAVSVWKYGGGYPIGPVWVT